MSEAVTRRWSAGRIVLLLALAAAGFAIAWQVSEKGGTAGTLPESASANLDPLAALEARIRENPRDGEGWSALAAGHFESGKFSEAVDAYAKAAELSPRDAALWSALGEARVMANARDPMPAAAAADFEKAIGLDSKDPRARYFLAVNQDLGGDHQGAIESWLALLADTPQGATWEADLRRTIEQVGKINKIDVARKLATVRQPASQLPVAARAIPGPDAQDLQSATAMRPAEQREMAEGMVARLEARLGSEPGNVDGWIMLIRSRATLGQMDDARAALVAAIAANPDSAAKLREQAALLGVR